VARSSFARSATNTATTIDLILRAVSRETTCGIITDRGRAVCADLAKLERATVEVFQGSEAAALQPDTLRTVAPEDWPAMKLRIHPAAQILALDWGVSALLRAVRRAAAVKPAERGAVKSSYGAAMRASSTAISSPPRPTLSKRPPVARRSRKSATSSPRNAGDQDSVAAMNRMLARWLSDNLLTTG